MQVFTSHQAVAMISAKADNNALLLMSLCQILLAVRMSKCQMFLKLEGRRQPTPIHLEPRGLKSTLSHPQKASLYSMTQLDWKLQPVEKQKDFF